MTTHNDPSRRTFLGQISSLGALLLHPSRGSAQETIPTRTIPATGLAIPIVGLGSTKAVLEIPTDGTEPLAAVLQRLVQLGGSVVDTAPRPEEIDRAFGRLLSDASLRDRLFIATKINAEGREAGIAQMRQTQRLFGRRTMDLVQIESLTDLDTQWMNLRSWKDSGEARHIGVTVSSYNGYERLESFMRRESPDFVHVNYSVMETRAEDRLLPLAQERGIAVLTNRPFMNGSYFERTRDRGLPAWAAEFDCTSWAQFSLKYILSHQAVTCALTETTNPRHLEENMRTAFGRFPDPATRRRMRELLG